MKPIDMMLDGIIWVAAEQEPGQNGDNSDGIPYATHSGVLEIAGMKLRCYRLNTGQAVIDGGDLEAFFQDMSDDASGTRK
mgnify:CR=1 FL=1